MPSSRIPSPARSHGAKSTPRRYKPRASRSVGSPARSNSSIKLTNIIQLNSFALSPMPSRKSILTDTSYIDIPRRKSWWKNLDENSREIMEALNNKEPAEANNAIEEYIEVDVLSQEKKNYSVDIPESSDGESISSIVIPQRKLFTQKESKPKKKFAQIIDNRESLATLHKTHGDDDKTLNIGRKNLFSHGTKQRAKPLFPSALLNISASKTVNKTKELADTDTKGQVKSLFGNRPGTKRKNMFADFIVSDSEDEIPELQPKIFGFQKKLEQKRRQNLKAGGGRESHITSPTSSITDIEIDDWKLLPSSTMVDHQLEDGLGTTPSKRARLGKLSEATESNSRNNTTANKSKQFNKSSNSKRTSKKNFSHINEMEGNALIVSKTDTPELDKAKKTNTSGTKNISYELSLREQTLKNKESNKSKNVSLMKSVTLVKVPCEVANIVKDKSLETSKNSKIVSKIDQALQSDDDEDFTLVYDNDANEVECEGNETIIGKEQEELKQSLNINKNSVNENVSIKQNKSKSQHMHHSSQIDNNRTVKQKNDKLHNDQCKNAEDTIQDMSINNEQQESSEQQNIEAHYDEIYADQAVKDNIQNNSKYNHKIVNYKEREMRNMPNTPDIADGHEPRQECNISNTVTSNKDDYHANTDICQKEQDFEDGQKLINEEIADEQIIEEEQNISIAMEHEEEVTNDSDENINLEKGNNSEEVTEEDIDQKIEDLDEEESEDDENTENQEDDEFNNHECEKAKSLDVELEKSNNYEVNENDMDDEVNNDEDEYNDNRRGEVISKRERCYVEVKQNVLAPDKDNDKNISNDNKGISKDPDHFDEVNVTSNSSKNTGANVSHDTTGRHRQKKHVDKVPSPEVILYEKQSQTDSFTVQGRNTSVRKTKSIIKNLTIRLSLAPVKESIDLSNGSRNSSAERSGWDSHRTTRATLRQTFGKDFTPRKSLRALVMEKSAKRRTNFAENIGEISRFPQANSTELPGSVPFDMDDSDTIKKITKFYQEEPNEYHDVNKTDNSGDKYDINETNDAQESDQEVPHNIEESDKVMKIHHDFSQKINNTNDDDQDLNESDHDHKTNDSDQTISRDIDDCDVARKYNESDQTHENNNSDNAHEINEPDNDNSNDLDENNDSDEAQEMNESDNEDEIANKDVAYNDHDTEANDTYSQEVNEFDNNDLHDSDEVNEVSAVDVSNDVQEMDSPETAQEINRSNDTQQADESDDAQEMDEFEDAHETIESDRELSCNEENFNILKTESGRDQSRKTRQTTLEIYLQKVKRQNIERKKQLEDEIRNTLKAPTRDMLNPFKIPAIPTRRMRLQKTKPKQVKSSVIPINMLPVEVLEDMKYKPPKRYRPTNASWITKRLYKFLEAKLEPKYDYKARVRSEKLVETIYNFTKDIRRHGTAPPDAVDALKREMARLDVVKTHFEFYEFFHEYMPREVRVKVVPDVFNKISLPKYGVFSDILR